MYHLALDLRHTSGQDADKPEFRGGDWPAVIRSLSQARLASVRMMLLLRPDAGRQMSLFGYARYRGTGGGDALCLNLWRGGGERVTQIDSLKLDGCELSLLSNPGKSASDGGDDPFL